MASGPTGKPRTAVQFNGKNSFLEVPASKALKTGTGDFSVSVWVNGHQQAGNMLGDIISQYDPQSRTGWRLGIDSRPGVTSSQSNTNNLHFGIDQGRESAWIDHGRLGEAILIFSMAVHDGQLFAGTCVADAQQAGRVFRFDGKEWTDCGSPDKCNAVSSLAEFNGKLYAGVGKYRLGGSSLTESENPHLGGAVYRYDGDNQWTFCGRLPEVEAINGMVVFRGKLYASSMYAPAGLFRYEGGEEWTSCGTPDGKRVESMTVYDGHIFASGYDEGAVYRYDGTAWTHSGHIEGATQTYGFAVHNGRLFVSEWPNAMVYRYEGGTKWSSAGRLGNEKETMPLVVYNGKMYGGTLPLAEVYRYEGDTKWTNVGRIDHTPDVVYRRVWSMAVFQGRLFAGTLPSGHVHSVEFGKNVTHDRALAPGWRHIAAVKKSGRLALYVDGKSVGTSSEFKTADFDLSIDAPIRIGFGATGYFDGRLSDLRIYNRALQVGEIKEMTANVGKKSR